MYVGVVVLLRNLPLYGGRFDSPLIRDIESRRDVRTGQSTGWALVYATEYEYRTYTSTTPTTNRMNLNSRELKVNDINPEFKHPYRFAVLVRA